VIHIADYLRIKVVLQKMSQNTRHKILKCSRFLSQRACLTQRLLLFGVYEETPIRALCAQIELEGSKEGFMFFVECGVEM
jgi:hypothetical protein